MKKLRRCLKRTGWVLLLGTILGLVFTWILVLSLRWVRPPFSALMMERRIESWSRPKPYSPHFQWVSLDQIAPCMGLAVIAAEDQNFPDHFGFDWKAIEKAMEHNEKSRRKRGASTVSMQTAKNLFLWESRTWIRKGAEAYFTLLLETLWSKKRILEIYLNIIEFGDGIFGVEAASRQFFQKPARQLKPSEAALFAAVLPNPRKYSAAAPNAYVRNRQQWILRQMTLLGGERLIRDLGE